MYETTDLDNWDSKNAVNLKLDSNKQSSTYSVHLYKVKARIGLLKKKDRKFFLMFSSNIFYIYLSFLICFSSISWYSLVVPAQCILNKHLRLFCCFQSPNKSIATDHDLIILKVMIRHKSVDFEWMSADFKLICELTNLKCFQYLYAENKSDVVLV